MRPTQSLQNAGQSIWLDNITRGMLGSGELQRYVDELSVTGLTSNPSIFQKAFTETSDYQTAIAAAETSSPEELFMQLAIEDLQAAADVFADVHARTDGVDGWVSLEVSPLLAYDAQSTIEAAVEVHQRLARPNVFIKIPGTPQGLPAVEEAIYRGIPVNVTLLFSLQQYLDCVAAYQRGITRRIGEGLDADVASVASVFISRWDAAVVGRVPAELTGKLALAVGESVHHAYVQMLNDTTQQTIATSGGRPQRLLFASTSTKDPSASDTVYVEGLIASNTINTMPDATLQAFADHGRVGRILDGSGGTSQAVLGAFAEHGIDVPTLGVELQEQGAQAFVTAWQDLMQVLARS